ncbi:hypothetical protein [Solimonas fluminis]|uniref:hypothetical protein n=1 Tax=Solimonas fluminis TaxID=2086571 RepID=UPI001056FF35|nr:hypothetical protein [Solimonas fluminis]
MSNIEYLCIDDQQGITIDPLLGRLSESGTVTFQRSTPRGLEEQLPAIEAFIRSKQGGLTGILLDLRLDVDADESGKRVAYRGPTLAQELRTRMAEGGLPPFPIVLWSVNAKFRQSYTGDESSHDLFDDIYEKDREIAENPALVSKKLAALAHGYAALRGISRENAISVLGLDAEKESPLYLQFLAEYLDAVTRSPSEVGHFLLNDLVRPSGLLITEEMLAARLGVDISASGDQWGQIKSALGQARYSGPFSDGWPRWWWFRVEDWWASLGKQSPEIRRLAAEERVAYLGKMLGLSLTSAKPIEGAASTKYFTLCAGLGLPLDPLDGLKTFKRTTHAWHDASYVSIYAALERIARSQWQLDPLERDRLARIKESRG